MKIKKIKLEKVHGLLDKEFNLSENYNFFVGINGSGKTTILKIISKFLENNLTYFEELFFKKIIFILKNANNKEIEIEITKDISIEVIVNKQKIQNEIFWTKDYFIELGIIKSFLKLGLSRELLRENEYKVNNLFENKENDLTQEIKEQIINVVNPITQIKSKLNEYGLRNLPEIEKIRFEIKEKKKKEKITKVMGKYQKRIDTLENKKIDEKMLKKYRRKLNSKGEPQLNLEMITEMFDYLNTLNNLEKYKEDRNKEIEEVDSKNIEITNEELYNNLPLELKNYLSYINNLFLDTNKELIYNLDNGEFQFKYVKLAEKYKEFIPNSTINFNSLSSGEKELFILITELYLFRQENSIIIIDEPEDSLHVHWQLNLFKDLKKMYRNRESQFIVATHSPEILDVSNHEKQFSLPALGRER